MNTLSLDRKALVVRGLADSMSLRAIGRMTRTDKDTVTRVLVEVGEFCSMYQDFVLTNLPCKRIEADEIWSFVGAKEANKTRDGQGDLWTYTAICADTKLAVSWLVGPRNMESTQAFMVDLADRLTNRIQLSTDGLNWYPRAVANAFDWKGPGVDYAIIRKTYGNDGGERGRGRYSPSSVVIEVEKVPVMGNPNPRLISTSYVERQNLNMRMQMRRFTRLTNAFSKKAENHAHAVSLHFMAYNFCKPHGTLTKKAKGIKTSPAMAAGLTDHVWTFEEVLGLMDPTRLLYATANCN
jgi:IS1 family transposase